MPLNISQVWKKHFGSRIKLITLAQHIGREDYKKYLIAKNNELICVTVNGIKVCVRKGTPDIRVAVSCLKKNEFIKLREYLSPTYGGTIIDAGGYIGTAAIAFSLMFPRANVLSIEPSLANLEILRKNVAPYENIKAIHGALVAHKGSSVVLRDRGTGPYGYTVVEIPGDAKNAAYLEECPAITFESLRLNASDVGILKLDIEGGEADLFEGNVDFLKEIKIIVAEMHDRIVPRSTKSFLNFSSQRIVCKTRNEQYFSIKH